MEKKQDLLLERMSHELRIPMNSIIGLTYLSKENIDFLADLFDKITTISEALLDAFGDKKVYLQIKIL